MESSTIIKLRQAESKDIATNGSYSVSLKEPILLEKGDICKVHTAIIDTTSESVVELATDTRINMGIGKYMRNLKVADTTATPDWYNYTATPASAATPDFATPISFCAVKTETGANDFKVTQIAVGSSSQDVLRDFGGLELQFRYIEVGTDIEKIFHINIPKLPIIDHLEKPVMYDIDHLVRTKSFVCITPTKTLRKHRVNTSFFTISVPSNDRYKPTDTDGNLVIFGNNGDPLASGSGVIVPFEEILSFDLKAGTYTPGELASSITDKMADLQLSGPVGNKVSVKPGVFPVNNPCLRTSYDILDRINTITTVSDSMVFEPESNKDYPTPGYFLTPVLADAAANRTKELNLLIGANEVSLNFDDTLQKLNFDIIHFPIYGGVGPTELTPIIDYIVGNDSAGNPLPLTPQVSQGGIFFTRLESKEIKTLVDGTVIEGINTDFWTQLGFDDAVVQPSHDTLNPVSGVIQCQIEFKVGQHITSAFVGLDSIVDKSLGGKQLIATTGGSETTLTTPIISSREFNNVENNEGYYLLEIGTNIPQRMVGGATNEQTTSNKVQSIIGKYYSQNGNFLQDDGSGSIVYEHNSDIPQILSDLNVRILHADLTPPEENEIGPKNSVFLEIIKTSQ